MKSFIALCCFFISLQSLAQDERFYRQIFTGELKEEEKKDNEAKIIVESDVYKLDLNQDGEDEGLVLYKKDGLDYISIFRANGKRIFDVKIPAKAFNSKIDKIYLKSINKTDAVLVVHFYEGAHEAVVFQASARLYFITYSIKELKDFNIFQGPSYFHELEKTRDQYELRGYSVNVVDLNNDGVKEIRVGYNKIERIYFYQGGGRWSSF